MTAFGQWLAIADVARILPNQPDPRHVRRLAARAESGDKSIGWKVRRTLRGRNSSALEVLLTSLPADAQAKHFAEAAKSAPRLRVANDDAPAALRSWHRASENQRQRASERLAAIVAYELFLEEHGKRKGRTLAKKRWVRVYALEHEDLGVSLRSLERWRKAYHASGRNIAALIDGNDGSARRGKVAIPEQIADEFKALYLRATKPKVSTCYKRLKKVAKARGWTLPSYDTFRRYADSLPPSVVTYFREPDKRRENIRPFIQRDYDDPEFRAMQIIQSDHHQIDVAVACGDAFCTVGHYPWITVWIDVRSRKVLAVEVYIEHPNSRRILQLLARVILENGVPQYVYADNGMDYVKAVGRWSVKHFEVGRRSAKIVDVAGWTPELVERISGPFEMEAIFSTEGNPQSKLIERWFNTLKDILYALYDSYRGALGERSERAEWLRQHPAELPNICDFAVDVQRAIEEYNATPHRGEGMHGRSPNEVFESTRLPRRDADASALAIAFWTEKVGAKVQRLGIKHHHRWYALPAAAQVEYFGRKVNFRYDEEAPERIVVYDAAGRFIAEATTRTKAPQRRGAEAIADEVAKRNAEWQQLQDHIRAYNPAAAKRLEAIGASVEDYYRLIERTSAQPAAAAASGAGVVTVVDTHLSPLARQIEKARNEIASGSLSPEELAIAASIELPEAEELRAESAAPRLELVVSEPVIHTPATNADEQWRREREAEGFCSATPDCPFAGDPFCAEHSKEIFGQ